MKKVLKYIKNPKTIIVYLMNKGLFSFLPDKIYLQWKYKLIMNQKLDLNNPQTFNEKLQWLKLYDRKDIYTIMADKYAVREYVKNKIGEEYLIPLLGVYNNFDEINFEELPEKFVIKPNHTSGNVYICTDKNEINYKKLKKQINKWLKRKYYYLHREWPYKNIKPKIIIEEYLDDLSGDTKDYKFEIFNGHLAYSFVCSDRHSNLKFTFFDKNGKFMDITQDNCPNDKNIKKPINYKKMIELSQKLAEETIELRVDFYEIGNKIYFGELTFYDSAGYGEFKPDVWDLKIGKMLKLPIRK